MPPVPSDGTVASMVSVPVFRHSDTVPLLLYPQMPPSVLLPPSVTDARLVHRSIVPVFSPQTMPACHCPLSALAEAITTLRIVPPLAAKSPAFPFPSETLRRATVKLPPS